MQQYSVKTQGENWSGSSKDQFVQLLLDRAEESLEATHALAIRGRTLGRSVFLELHCGRIKPWKAT